MSASSLTQAKRVWNVLFDELTPEQRRRAVKKIKTEKARRCQASSNLADAYPYRLTPKGWALVDRKKGGQP